MRYVVFVFAILVSGCAYGNVPPQQQEYGSTKGNQPPDPNDSNNNGVGSSDDPIVAPTGCFLEQVIDNGAPTLSFVVCPAIPEMEYKYLVDPCPFKN